MTGVSPDPVLERGWVEGELAEELPGLGLWSTRVLARSGRSPKSVRDRLRVMAGRITGGHVAMEVLHLLTGLAQPSTLGVAQIYDLRTMEVDREPVVPEPDCPVCGHLQHQKLGEPLERETAEELTEGARQSEPVAEA